MTRWKWCPLCYCDATSWRLLRSLANNNVLIFWKRKENQTTGIQDVWTNFRVSVQTDSNRWQYCGKVFHLALFHRWKVWRCLRSYCWSWLLCPPDGDQTWRSRQASDLGYGRPGKISVMHTSKTVFPRFQWGWLWWFSYVYCVVYVAWTCWQ